MNILRFLLKTVFCLVAVLVVDSVCAEEKELTAQQFLCRARHPVGRRSWASLQGNVSHRRRGMPTIIAPLYLGVVFSPDRTLAQIVIDRRQGYFVGQTFAAGSAGTSVIPMDKKGYGKPLLSRYGVRPQDLTMTFLYWKFVRELAGVYVKGTSCRVFVLLGPDKKETLHAYINKKYYFPMKVEWFKNGAKIPFRTMQVKSFKKQDNLWLVNKIGLYGPGWRTLIVFDDTNVGYIQKGIPNNLFKKIEETPK